MLAGMNFDGIALFGLLLGLLVLFDIAALMWGVDSRLVDVRSDLIVKR